MPQSCIKVSLKLFFLESRHDGDESDDEVDVDNDDDDIVDMTTVSRSQDVCMASSGEENIPMSEEPISDLGKRFVI